MHQRLQSGTAARTSAIFNGVLVVFLVFSIAVVILFLALLVQLWKQQILLLPGRKQQGGEIQLRGGDPSTGTILWNKPLEIRRKEPIRLPSS